MWYDAGLNEIPIEKQQSWHHFTDHDVFFWRSSWTPDATSFAFKCGPSEGHHTSSLLREFPDWRLSSGHAHPDANSFIIFAGGHYMTGDTGYAGLPLTEHHNTLLFNGRGQAKEGVGHDAFAGVSYERLNRIRIAQLNVEKDCVSVRGDATNAYEPELGVKRFVREFVYRPREGFTIRDEVETLKPSVISSIIHADGGLEKETNDLFRINREGTKLLIQLVEPAQVDATIKTNTVTAPGPPGAVDKAEIQQRGQKLLLSTRQAVTKAHFVLRLTVGTVSTSRTQ